MGGFRWFKQCRKKTFFSADVCPISGSNLIFVFGYIRPFLCQILMRIQLQSLRGSLSDLSLLLWHQRCPNIQVLKIQHPISSGSFEEEEKNGVIDACSTTDIFDGCSSGPVWSTSGSQVDLSESYLISSKCLLFKNIAHDGSFQHWTWLCLGLP